MNNYEIDLNDPHERSVLDIMEWYLTECDINRDIKVNDCLHYTGIKIQVKHLDHPFRIYIKSMGKDTVCRVEEGMHPDTHTIEAVNNIFNPNEKIEKRLAMHEKLLQEILSRLTLKLDAAGEVKY